jgi:hypothetical protein
MCFKYIKYTINEKFFAKHRKIKEDINNEIFSVRDNTIQIFLFPIKEPFWAEQLTKNLIQ